MVKISYAYTWYTANLSSINKIQNFKMPFWSRREKATSKTQFSRITQRIQGQFQVFEVFQDAYEPCFGYQAAQFNWQGCKLTWRREAWWTNLHRKTREWHTLSPEVVTWRELCRSESHLGRTHWNIKTIISLHNTCLQRIFVLRSTIIKLYS